MMFRGNGGKGNSQNIEISTIVEVAGRDVFKIGIQWNPDDMPVAINDGVCMAESTVRQWAMGSGIISKGVGLV